MFPTSRYEQLPDQPRYTRTTMPMSIPGARSPVPPAQPPPRHPAGLTANNDPGFQWANDPTAHDFGRPATVRPGSSLLGGRGSDETGQERERWRDRTTFDHGRHLSITTRHSYRDVEMLDVGAESAISDVYDSLSSTSSQRLASLAHPEKEILEQSSSQYDKQLLSRIGGPNGPLTPKRGSIPPYSQNNNDIPQGAYSQQIAPVTAPNSQTHMLSATSTSSAPQAQYLPPLALKGRSNQSVVDSPSSLSWLNSPGPISHHSSHGPSDASRPQTRHGSLTLDDRMSRQGSSQYESPVFAHEDATDDSRMMAGDYPDQSDDGRYDPRPGTKRRASSPPKDASRDERVTDSVNAADAYIRRPLQPPVGRGSSSNRFPPISSSLSSNASSSSSYAPRHGSLGSSLGVSSIPSSATSYGSDRHSPNTLSPAFDSEVKAYPGSTYGTLGGGSSASHGVPAYMQPYHHHQQQYSPSHPSQQRNAQADTMPTATSNTAESSRPPNLNVSGVFMCQCCPKKPKKFKTMEDLRIHESEKQYTCQYCNNRFKNKNEAERHQNSLHLRKNSWSCAALTGVELAFHRPSDNTNVDMCSYCGETFPNPPRWDDRAEHLNSIHKFGECNQAKKFFRADHFRQHLKHSHAGTSGKWTNMLESACMREEPMPEKRIDAAGPPQVSHSSTVTSPVMAESSASAHDTPKSTT